MCLSIATSEWRQCLPWRALCAFALIRASKLGCHSRVALAHSGTALDAISPTFETERTIGPICTEWLPSAATSFSSCSPSGLPSIFVFSYTRRLQFILFLHFLLFLDYHIFFCRCLCILLYLPKRRFHRPFWLYIALTTLFTASPEAIDGLILFSFSLSYSSDLSRFPLKSRSSSLLSSSSFSSFSSSKRTLMRHRAGLY